MFKKKKISPLPLPLTFTPKIFFICLINYKKKFFPDELRLVKDKVYGSKNQHGEWDGMVGELIRKVYVRILKKNFNSPRESWNE